MIVFGIALAHLMGLISAVHAVMRARTSQGAVAWAVSLNAFPYLVVPAYWLFWRSKFEGYVVARRRADQAYEAIRREVVASAAPYRIPLAAEEGAVLAAERLAGLPLLGGNRVDLLIDGADTFASIFRGIDRAEQYVLIQFYVVRDDDIGQALEARLLAAAARGVRVCFLYDEFGSSRLSDSYGQTLRAGGVEVYAFNTRKKRRNRFQLNFRNHRKIVVVDGRIAWAGGHNVGDEYLGRSERFGHWRDTHIRLEGPAVLGVQIAFAEDWHWAAETLLDLRWTAVPAADGSDALVLVMPSGPADPLETTTLMFVQAINSAVERIWIASPYFVPDESVIVALQLAALRGVDVRILIPDQPDHKLVYLAAFSYFDGAAQAGVNFHRYTDGFLHQKVILIDDRVAAVGTANLDNRSCRLNFEITIFVPDPPFVAAVDTMLRDDFARSRTMGPHEAGQKPWWFRLSSRLARLAAPVL